MDPLTLARNPSLGRAAQCFVLPVGAALALRLTLNPEIIVRAPGWLALLLLTLTCLALLGTAAAARLPQGPTPLSWQAGGLFLLAINAGYQSIGGMLSQGMDWRGDALLREADRVLLGGSDAQVWLAAWINPGLSDLLALAYLFFLLLLPLVSLNYVFRGDAETKQRYWRGLMTVYGLGFAGYLVLPAAGPYLHHPAQLPALAHGLVSGPIHGFIARQSTGVDVWPSLHCAVTLYIQVWLWRVAPRWGRPLVPVTILVILSTLYLQYHYFIDVLCGVALAWLGSRAARRDENP